MRKSTFIALTTGVLWIVGCQKTDVTPLEAPSTTLSSDVVACTEDVISFNGVAPGTLLTQVSSDGGASVDVSSTNPHYVGAPYPTDVAVVFRSSPAPVSSTEDLDLRSPGAPYAENETEPNPGFENTVPLGNILVLHNFKDYPNPAVEPNDDDFSEFEAPGTIAFDFSGVGTGTITATSLTAIDVEFAYNGEGESGFVTLYTSNPATGGTQIGLPYRFADTGPNGVQVLSLGNTPGVGYIVVSLVGSIGIDNLRFCRPTPPSGQCTRTQGYWKNHPDAWPVSSLTLGGISYSKAELITILKTPVRSNGLIALAYQLIAAKLNVIKGTDPTPIAASITLADNMFIGKDLRTSPQPSASTSSTSTLVGLLDDYNNGRSGPRHCQ
ncbi:hypothetical protein [Hymenobacter sp. B81]|uniref:hypothetical protein n=1 Tax=Hymenobacter sp. B81 TaxID=3344878 RepID=UPI0037DCDA07